MSSVEEIYSQINELKPLEIAELIQKMEDGWGVSAAPAAVAVAAAGSAEVAEEQTEFDVILTAIGDKKIQVIKEVRAITGLGLKEAKELVDGAPKTVKDGITKDEAEEIKKKFEAEGASAEIK